MIDGERRHPRGRGSLRPSRKALSMLLVCGVGVSAAIGPGSVVAIDRPADSQACRVTAHESTLGLGGQTAGSQLAQERGDHHLSMAALELALPASLEGRSTLRGARADVAGGRSVSTDLLSWLGSSSSEVIYAIARPTGSSGSGLVAIHVPGHEGRELIPAYLEAFMPNDHFSLTDCRWHAVDGWAIFSGRRHSDSVSNAFSIVPMASALVVYEAAVDDDRQRRYERAIIGHLDATGASTP